MSLLSITPSWARNLFPLHSFPGELFFLFLFQTQLFKTCQLLQSWRRMKIAGGCVSSRGGGARRGVKWIGIIESLSPRGLLSSCSRSDSPQSLPRRRRRWRHPRINERQNCPGHPTWRIHHVRSLDINDKNMCESFVVPRRSLTLSLSLSLSLSLLLQNF